MVMLMVDAKGVAVVVVQPVVLHAAWLDAAANVAAATVPLLRLLQ